jgi:hypothetical protein
LLGHFLLNLSNCSSKTVCIQLRLIETQSQPYQVVFENRVQVGHLRKKFKRNCLLITPFLPCVNFARFRHF